MPAHTRNSSRAAPRISLVALAALGLSAIMAQPAQATDLTVEIANVRSDAGRVLVAVHKESAHFPDASHVAGAVRASARSGAMQLVVENLAPGRYGVTVFHDENDNGELDANLLGIPTEGYGFSNDAPATFGPPKFTDVAVEIAGAAAATALNLVY